MLSDVDIAVGVAEIPTRSYNPPMEFLSHRLGCSGSSRDLQLQDQGRGALGANTGISPMALGSAAHSEVKQKVGK